MGDRDQESVSSGDQSGAQLRQRDAATCHPDVTCPVCAARGKLVRMLPIKAHVQCPECRYFDSCCM